MRMRRWRVVLAVLMARLFPSRGRHSVSGLDEAGPRLPDPDTARDFSPSDMTVFDHPPGRVRPYVKPPAA
ncbi:MAG: hypothetical protein WAK82_00815 [Streptosporangiaceae bacterium]